MARHCGRQVHPGPATSSGVQRLPRRDPCAARLGSPATRLRRRGPFASDARRHILRVNPLAPSSAQVDTHPTHTPWSTVMANVPGPQPDVARCPHCTGNLRNVPRSEMKSRGYVRSDGSVAEDTHTYECTECHRRLRSTRTGYRNSVLVCFLRHPWCRRLGPGAGEPGRGNPRWPAVVRREVGQGWIGNGVRGLGTAG